MSAREVALKGVRRYQPTASDVWAWPEFQAFIKRLGVAEGDTSFLRITITGPQDPVGIEHTYQAVGKSEQLLQPKVDMKELLREAADEQKRREL